MRYEVAGFGVQVVLLEPGLIRSGFADAAHDAAEADGPYGQFNRSAIDGMSAAYETGLARHAGGVPDDVAAVVRRALEARNPKPRYTVTPSAKMFIAPHAVMPDRLWDRSLRAMMPAPPTN